ncbi:hypothetical protein [Thioalbus denitrificans]|uniref:Uncharacterized protein n=1 Tax=Thioalbus denitrificans TaxID=547122 RepID=A0A369CCS8_9GAMM|nr:hypothetical protein [Thioalbus denitrificans]RCX31709.1 hypothetical protein DFQ59_10256 [Thioalbus denitrificans]
MTDQASLPVEGGVYKSVGGGVFEVLAVGKYRSCDCFAIQSGNEVHVHKLQLWRLVPELRGAELLNISDDLPDIRGVGLRFGCRMVQVRKRGDEIQLEPAKGAKTGYGVQ